MKKLLLMILMMIAFHVSAQQADDNVLVSKSGKVILPEAGDYAVGIAANPFVNFVGNMFNGSTDNNFRIWLLSGGYLYGKYFISPQAAYRAKVFINFSNNKHFDTENSNYSTELIFGYEKRRGESRFQFLYGPEILVGASGSSSKFLNNLNNSINQQTKENRIFIGARGFAGAEYFIFPKISLAAEMGFSIKGSVWGERSRQFLEEPVQKRDIGFFSIGTDLLDGNLMLMFHF
jgi:hypothetical protein